LRELHAQSVKFSRGLVWRKKNIDAFAGVSMKNAVGTGSAK
jgi:hypothetical protein